MKDFSEYLKKFKLLLNNKTAETGVIIQVVNEITGIQLVEKQITFKNTVLFVNTSSLQKNAIYMSQEKILTHCKQKGVILTEIR